MLREGNDYHSQMLAAQRDQQKEIDNWTYQKVRDQKEDAKFAHAEIEDKRQKIQSEQTYNNQKYLDHAREKQREKEEYMNFAYTKTRDHDAEIKQNYFQSQELAAEQYRSFQELGSHRQENIDAVSQDKQEKADFHANNADDQDDRIGRSRKDDAALKEEIAAQGADDKEEVLKSYDDLKNENEMREMEEDRWAGMADVKREQANEEIHGNPYTAKKPYNQYTPGTLAQQYDQGVTEETYEEGNKKIIKRVVVKGNKADEYKMVVAKSGTYYFKNGYSITKVTWKNETEKRASSMD